MDNQSPQEDKEVLVGKFKVKVLRSVCISAATCVAVSPNVFELDAERKAIVKAGATDEESNIIMAAQACPTRAIVIVDTETGKQVWPD
jgi:ferredoxin